MRSQDELDRLRERAIALRRAGRSVQEIRAALGPIGHRTLGDLLRGEPPPAWTRRPNARDDLREAARQLRTQGLDYEEIAASLGVSKSSVSLWVRDLPIPPGLSPEECRKRSAEASRRYARSRRSAREARLAGVAASAADTIGLVTDREILIAGAIAYWCGGAKNKPYSRRDRVVFINSDPALIGFFLKFLDTAGIPRDELIFRLYIHETADVEKAQRFWLALAGVQSDQFRSPVLKHHNPKTVRKNVGESYRGCLRIDVRKSSDLYRKIEGWAAAIMMAPSAEPAQPVSLSRVQHPNGPP